MIIDSVYTINIINEDESVLASFVFKIEVKNSIRSESLRNLRKVSSSKAKRNSKSEQKVNNNDNNWNIDGKKINFKNWLDNLKKGLLLHVSMTTSESGSKISQSDAIS